jgi:hypothetical protein
MVSSLCPAAEQQNLAVTDESLLDGSFGSLQHDMKLPDVWTS